MLSTDQRTRYEQIRQTALADLETIDREIEAELGRVKKRLLELQEDKKAVKQIVDGASARLGTPTTGPLKELNIAELSRQVAATEEGTASGGRRSLGASAMAFGSSTRPGE